MSLNERGIAVPMALIILAVVASLTMAFSVLATTEPTIATNHELGSKARALAETGVERALWALSHPTQPGGIPDPLGGTAAAPYDGTAYVSMGARGGFTVKVSSLAAPNERKIEAIGWSPTNDPTDPKPKGVKRIETVVMRIKKLDPPCALCVEGEVEITGTSNIQAKANFCPDGPPPDAGTMTKDMTYLSGNAKVWGPGNNVPNEPQDTLMNAPDSKFDFMFKDDEIAYIKLMAKANGTYFQGPVVFDSSNPMPDGIVFVDTTTGDPFTAATADSDAGYTEVHGGIDWKGWLIVAGSVYIDGDSKLKGLVYAQNDLSYYGRGTAKIEGAVVSENRKDTVATTIDANSSGNSTIVYNCDYVRNGGGALSQNWFVKVGTYKELEGSTHN